MTGIGKNPNPQWKLLQLQQKRVAPNPAKAEEDDAGKQPPAPLKAPASPIVASAYLAGTGANILASLNKAQLNIDVIILNATRAPKPLILYRPNESGKTGMPESPKDSPIEEDDEPSVSTSSADTTDEDTEVPTGTRSGDDSVDTPTDPYDDEEGDGDPDLLGTLGLGTDNVDTPSPGINDEPITENPDDPYSDNESEDNPYDYYGSDDPIDTPPDPYLDEEGDGEFVDPYGNSTDYEFVVTPEGSYYYQVGEEDPGIDNFRDNDLDISSSGFMDVDDVETSSSGFDDVEDVDISSSGFDNVDDVDNSSSGLVDEPRSGNPDDPYSDNESEDNPYDYYYGSDNPVDTPPDPYLDEEGDGEFIDPYGNSTDYEFVVTPEGSYYYQVGEDDPGIDNFKDNDFDISSAGFMEEGDGDFGYQDDERSGSGI